MKLRIDHPQKQAKQAAAILAQKTEGAMPLKLHKKPLPPVDQVQVKTLQPQALQRLREEVRGEQQEGATRSLQLTKTGSSKTTCYPYFIYIPAITISQFINGNGYCAVDCNGQTAILTGRPYNDSLKVGGDSLSIFYNTSDTSQMNYTGSNGNFSIYCMADGYNIYNQPWANAANNYCTGSWYMIFDSVFDTNSDANQLNSSNLYYSNGIFKNNNYNFNFGIYSSVYAYPAVYADQHYYPVTNYYNVWFVIDQCVMGHWLSGGFYKYTYKEDDNGNYTGDIYDMFSQNPSSQVDFLLFGTPYFMLPLMQYDSNQVLYFLKDQPAILGPEIDPSL